MPHTMGVRPDGSMERIDECIVNTMYPENQAFVRSLKDWKNTDTFCPRTVFATNMFEVTELPGHTSGYSGLARDISRLNHRYVTNCCANAHVTFDLETLTFIVRAALPILKGEEVTCSYFGSAFHSADARQAELKRRWGFVCQCQSCTQTGKAREHSDYFRNSLLERTVRYKSDDLLFAQWVMDGAPVRPPEIDADGVEYMNGFRLAQVTWDLCMRESYVDANLWEPVLARLVKAYSVLKIEGSVSFYAMVAGQLARTYTGEDRGWDAVMRNPRKTDWWGKLDKKRV